MSIFSSFANMFKRRETLVKEKCIPIKEAFDHVKNLLKTGITDFSLIKNLINVIKNEIDKTKDDKEGTEEKKLIFQVVRKYMKYMFKDIFDKLDSNKEKELQDYYHLTSMLNFLIMMVINYPNKIFIETIFEVNCNFMNVFFKCLKISLSFTEQYDAIKILMNVYSAQFLVVFTDNNLIEVYSVLKERLLKLTLNSFDFHKFQPSEYKLLIKHILVLEFNLKKIVTEVNICSEDDRPISKFINKISMFYFLSKPSSDNFFFRKNTIS